MIKQDDILVSVCLPIFNGEKYLQEALDSLKSQTYQNLELIVSDDNSQDKSLELIENFQKSCGFHVQIYQHQPTSIGVNWNNCLKHANGKYIKFLFQDDVLYPECIKKMVNQAEADENVNLVFCKRDFIIEENASISEQWMNEFEDLQKKQTLLHGDTKILGKKLLRSPHILEEPTNKIGEPVAVLFRKSVIDRVGYFNEQLTQLLDIEYWYRILKHGSVVFKDEKLAAFRLHSNQTTAINNDSSIEDYDLFPYILYKDFFRYLHYRVQKKLLFKYNPAIKKINSLIS